jgi:hypothetical protein
MTEEEGLRLAMRAGQTIRVECRCQRTPSTGSNVVATKGHADRRVVVFAHIDSRSALQRQRQAAGSQLCSAGF